MYGILYCSLYKLLSELTLLSNQNEVKHADWKISDFSFVLFCLLGVLGHRREWERERRHQEADGWVCVQVTIFYVRPGRQVLVWGWRLWEERWSQNCKSRSRHWHKAILGKLTSYGARSVQIIFPHPVQTSKTNTCGKIRSTKLHETGISQAVLKQSFWRFCSVLSSGSLNRSEQE